MFILGENVKFYQHILSMNLEYNILSENYLEAQKIFLEKVQEKALLETELETKNLEMKRCVGKLTK